MEINNSYTNNNIISTVVSGTNFAGGLVGEQNSSSIANSHANNNVIIAGYVGGLVGWNAGSRTLNSYATNNTTNGTTSNGGLDGLNHYSPIASSYYNKDTFTGTTPYGSGKTTGEMITQGTYTGWDFSANWKPMSGTLTGYYPCLAWQSESTCTKAPSMISDCTELQAIGTDATTLAGNYQLAGDIDCSATSTWNVGLGFKPIGDSATQFNGTLDGKGYKIIGLSINRPAEMGVGLFGYTNGSTVKNIGIDGANIQGNYAVGGLIGLNGNSSSVSNSYSNNSAISGGISGFGAGGLAGYNYNNSLISNSHASNDAVNGNHSVGGLVGNTSFSIIINSFATKNTINGGGGYMGGLVGSNESSSSVSSSYAKSNTISGSHTVGGLVGFSQVTSTISNSYAIDNSVSGGTNGGLVGNNGGNYYDSVVTNSYATNNTISGSNPLGSFIGYSDVPVTSSYYNINSFTGTTIYGSYGIGKTTGEMTTQGTYTGWDFSANWKPMSGTLTGYYPCLAWQDVGSCVKPLSTYPGCDTPDIIVGTQTWSACNIGSTVAGLSSISYGDYYQGGRLDTGWTASWNTDNWGSGGQGPCANGYHVPTQPEWQVAYDNQGNNLPSTLKLPMAGDRRMLDGLLTWTGANGTYWSSSLCLSNNCYLNFTPSVFQPTTFQEGTRAYGFSVRCLKN